jgi:hypothetical protein
MPMPTCHQVPSPVTVDRVKATPASPKSPNSAVTPAIHFSAALRRLPSCVDPATRSASAAVISAGSASGDRATWLCASVVAVQLQCRPHPVSAEAGRPACGCSQPQLIEIASSRDPAVASSAVSSCFTVTGESCEHTGHCPRSSRSVPATHPCHAAS